MGWLLVSRCWLLAIDSQSHFCFTKQAFHFDVVPAPTGAALWAVVDGEDSELQ